MPDIHLTKLRGQHLLRDARVLADIVAAAELTRHDTVLEVGPGTGTLTVELAKRAGHVVAVELDRRFQPALTAAVESFKNVSILWNDIMRTDRIEGIDVGAIVGAVFRPPAGRSTGDLKVAPTLAEKSSFKIVSNLPYQITSPFLWKVLTDNGPDLIVLLLQKEVAERIAAKPPRMSLLAVMVQTFGTVEIVRQVSRSAFYPPPRVDSAVIQIRRTVPDFDRRRVLALAKAGFSHPRRKLSNNLKGFKLQNIPDKRAESLGIADWRHLLVQ